QFFPNHGKQKALDVPPCVGQFVQCLVHRILPYGHDSVGLKCNLILPTLNRALSFIGLESPNNSLVLGVLQEALSYSWVAGPVPRQAFFDPGGSGSSRSPRAFR
ncbi:MAG: hypothetical protein LJE91_10450, partial [Gammaproteobacteria bacterium]|nr:hypothetical protein [Gammaproteobacteria bacterium]